MSTPTLLIDLHYLPCLEYFACLLPYDTIRLEAHETYQKQTYRNRCYVLASQQVDRLTVPVIKGNSKIPYRALKLDDCQAWAPLHWRAICTAYSKAPFFTYLADYFHAVLFQRHVYLFDLNLKLLQTCLQLLQLEKKLELSTHYEKVPAGHVVDARATILPGNRLGHSSYYQPTQYQQVFGSLFHPNLSILDLLFCKGHEACTILQAAARGETS